MQYWNYLRSVLLLVVLNGRCSLGYKAAVFEHAQQSYKTSGKTGEIIKNNLEYYEAAADSAGSKGVDIMVFPEYGIFPDGNREQVKDFLEYIPDPNVTRSNPCQQPEIYADRPILYNLSCLARKHEMILVANMGDIQPCTGEEDCPEDGVFQFNTNVAFDRDGTLLAKYHKEQLFLEPGMDTPVGGQDPTFHTDLGRFAMFVSFEIFFKRMTEVAQWEGVEAVLLTTLWHNFAPLVNSFQFFESWAIGNNVTLLAANVQLPGISGVGSGIYSGGKGAQVYTFNPDGQSKLLISDLAAGEPSPAIYTVTLDGTEEWTDDGMAVGHDCSEKLLGPSDDIYTDYRCYEGDIRNFTLQRLVNSSGSVRVCNKGMCCLVEYSADGMADNFYVGVFNGTYNIQDGVRHYHMAEGSCFLARCDLNEDGSGANFPMKSETRFRSVYMRADVSTRFVYPSVMGSGMRLLTPQKEWGFETDGRTASINFNSIDGKDLLTLGFISRAYERDLV